MNTPISNGRAAHRALLRITLAAVQVFAWIFVFQYLYVRAGGNMAQAISSLALTFALVHIIVILLTPFTARRLRNGFKRPMFYGVISLSAAFAVLCASFAGYLGPIGWGVGIFAVLLGVYRAFYWVPYEFAREVGPSTRHPAWEIVAAIAPAVAGVSLAMSPVASVILLGLGAAGALVSLVPIMRIADMHEGFQWQYRQTFHELFAPSHRRMLYESLASGVEMAALILLWPLIIFLLLDWSYPMLGIVLSLTYLVALILRFVLRKPLMATSTPMRAILASSAWVMRLAVGGAAGVILVDTYFYVGSRASGRGVDYTTFEHSADNSTYIDEYTALKEMGMGIGRVLMSLFVAMLVTVVSVPLMFIIAFLCAAAAAGLAVLLSQTHAHTAQVL
jgi:hypothetical protein